MSLFAPLQTKIGKGKGIEAETIQVEFAAPHKKKSKLLLSRRDKQKLSEKKENKKKREYGLEAYGVEKEGQSNLRRFFKNPIRFLLGNSQLTLEDIKPVQKAEVKSQKEVTWEEDYADILIDKVLKSDLDPKEKREKAIKELNEYADRLEREGIAQISARKPLGKMSELAEVMGIKPGKGEPVATPWGTFVFSKKNIPSKDAIEHVWKLHKAAEITRTKVPDFLVWISEPKPHITTGNYRVVVQGKKLHEKGLLAPDEIKVLEKLEKFWQEHPELDKEKDVGMWNEKLELVPWKSGIGKPETKPIEEVHKHLEEKGIKPEPEKPTVKSGEFKPNAGLINKQLADRSHMGTSWDPEKRGEQEISGFVHDVQAVFDRLKPYAKTEAQKALLIEEMQRFQRGYAEKYNEKLAAHGRTISSFITGASKFPTRKAEKANASYEKKLQDMLEWKDRAEKAIIRKLKGEAIEEAGGEIPLLQKKIEQAEKLQEMMVEANKIIRKKPEPGVGGVSKLMQLVNQGFTEKQAAELLKPDFAGRLGFSFQLTNNSAEIRKLKERIAQLQRKEATETREIAFTGGCIVDNQEDDRVQIFFDQKPSQDIISKLKGEGWHWSPSIGAWQRKRTEYALMSANRITGAQAETQFKVLQANPRDVIGDPPNPIMRMQLLKLWREVLGAEDIGDFATFMKEAADLTYDEAKEKLLLTYGQPKPEQMTAGKEGRYFGAKALEAEERIHAGMCKHASEECRRDELWGDEEACRVACECNPNDSEACFKALKPLLKKFTSASGKYADLSQEEKRKVDEWVNFEFNKLRAGFPEKKGDFGAWIWHKDRVFSPDTFKTFLRESLLNGWNIHDSTAQAIEDTQAAMKELAKTKAVPEAKISGRKFPDRTSETRAVKDALKKAGIEAEVSHGTGTSWGWLEVNIGDPRLRNGLKPAPFEHQYTDEELALQNKVLKIAQEVTGRHGEYDGKISVLAQEWMRKPSKEEPWKRNYKQIEAFLQHSEVRSMEGAKAFKEGIKALYPLLIKMPEKEASDLRKQILNMDKLAFETLSKAKLAEPKKKDHATLFDMSMLKQYPNLYRELLGIYGDLTKADEKTLIEASKRLNADLEKYGNLENTEKAAKRFNIEKRGFYWSEDGKAVEVKTKKPEVSKSKPSQKLTEMPIEAAKPAEVKAKKKIRKPEILYTEYGRTIVKKARSGVIRLTDADMEADAVVISY